MSSFFTHYVDLGHLDTLKRYFCPSCFTELRSKTQETCHQCNKKINESINYFDLPEDYKITL